MARSRSRSPNTSPRRGSQSTELPANFRQGDWMCKSCAAHNYASKMSCHKCGGSKRLEPAKPENFRPGDWMCPCTAHNYASKAACHRCGKEKVVANTPEKFLPGDWMCMCGGHNYATKAQCHKCGTPKAMAAMRGFLSTPPSIFQDPLPFFSPTNFRSGDWLCACGAHNYASKFACYKCSTPKPVMYPQISMDSFEHLGLNLRALATFGAMFGGPVGSHPLPPNFRDGDWLCTCGAHNYASKVNCHKCGVPKDMDSQPLVSEGFPTNFRVGDWMCACGAHNYASKLVCHKCSASKQ